MTDQTLRDKIARALFLVDYEHQGADAWEASRLDGNSDRLHAYSQADAVLAELRAGAEAATLPVCYVCGCTGLCGGDCPNPRPVHLSIDHKAVLARIAAPRSWTAEAQRIPSYAMLDVFHAVTGTSHPEWDRFYEEHGYAESWARVIAMVRDVVRERDEARAMVEARVESERVAFAEAEQFKAERDEAEAALERVKELHKKRDDGWCAACSEFHDDGTTQDWPCPTAQALTMKED